MGEWTQLAAGAFCTNCESRVLERLSFVEGETPEVTFVCNCLGGRIGSTEWDFDDWKLAVFTTTVELKERRVALVEADDE